MTPPILKVLEPSSLPSYRWCSSLPARGNLLILHGLGSHCLRFQHFAELLNHHQWNIFAHNLRGHGSNQSSDSLGDFSPTGWQDCLDDVSTHATNIKAEFPNAPLFLLGQGVGSYLVQAFIRSNPKVVQGAILCGTNGPTTFSLSLLKMAVGLDRIYRKPSQPSPLLEKITASAWSQHISNPTDRYDWLSHDEDILQKYRSDPLCGFSGSIRFWSQLLHALQQMTSTQYYSDLPPDFPIFIGSGHKDPIGEFGVGTHRLMTRLGQAGLQRVSYRLYPPLRHEILWGAQTEQPKEDIVSWLYECVNSQRLP